MYADACTNMVRSRPFPMGVWLGTIRCLDTARACAAHFYVFRAAGNSKTEALINAYDVRT